MARHRFADPGDATEARAGLYRTAALVLVLLFAVAGTAAFRMTGDHWFVVRTPSMGTAAPVGSLVLTRPTDVSDLHVGDVIAYHPPSEPTETFTHRVIAVSAAGVHTRGDINGAADPWLITGHDIVGRAFAVPALGWLLRALPLLLVGGLVIWTLTALWAKPDRRGPLRLSGVSLLLSLCAYLLKPFVNVVQLETATEPDNTQIRVVSTGLLPVRLTATPGHGHAAPVDLSGAGRVGVSKLTGGGHGVRYQLQTHLHLAPWQWAVVALISFSPLLWTLLVGFRAQSSEAAVA